ncbi:hypothetical protein BKA60DRAFT_79527 [Fusarium oxysporum]|nr:hypothetical protein BKA60DRAFT_79527 [Fusarium oxysporum]
MPRSWIRPTTPFQSKFKLCFRESPRGKGFHPCQVPRLLDWPISPPSHPNPDIANQVVVPARPGRPRRVFDLVHCQKSNPPETPDRRPRQQIMPDLLMRCVNGKQEHWFQRSRVTDEELIYFRTMKSFIFYSWASDKTECRDQVAISEKRLFETPGTENASDELPREGTCSHLSVLSEFVSVGDGSHACILACTCILLCLVGVCLTGEQLRCHMSWQLS